MFFSGPDQRYGDNVNAITGKSADEVLSTYVAEFGEDPSAAFWAHAYDATALLLSAIDAVAVDDGSGNLTIDRQALRDEVAATAGYQALIGTLSCDEFGDCGATRITVVEQNSPGQEMSDVLSNVVFEFEG
jgi:branched-chain amino acid transport system substrate-binding protein